MIIRDLFRHFFDKAVQESLVLEPVEEGQPPPVKVARAPSRRSTNRSCLC